MTSNTPTLGIIAGSRSLPLILARSARELGIGKLVAVGFHGETDAALAGVVDELVWMRVGQLGKLIETFRKRGIDRCAMAGQIHPKNLFDLRPDFKALSLLIKLKERNARTIFAAIADELQRAGIELVDARPWLGPAMPGSGYAVGPQLTDGQREDVAFGFRIAKEISRLQIGQSVVVKNGTVLAVEGFEGTDACLQRGGELAGKGGGAVAVKVASEDHDFRFDIPCLGPQTVETCAAVKIAVLAFESGKSLVLDRDRSEELARQHRVTLISVG